MIVAIKKWLADGNRLERVWLLAKIEFKLRYYGNRLGLLWALINPVSQIFMYYIVFEVLMKAGIDNFPIYVFSGLFVWIFFTDITSRSVGLLRSKKQFYEHTDMNKLEIYAAQIISATIGFGFNFIIFLLFSVIYSNWPSIYYFFFILIYLNLVILSLGVALIISNLFLLFNDVNQIWSIVIRYGFFLSPILYRGKLFEEKVPILNYLNPISGIINNTRDILLNGAMPNWNMMLFDFGYATIILIIGLYMLKTISVRASELV